MRYEGKMYRPPSEGNAYILQATNGCSWNACTYCDIFSPGCGAGAGGR